MGEHESSASPQATVLQMAAGGFRHRQRGRYHRSPTWSDGIYNANGEPLLAHSRELKQGHGRRHRRR
ncbi:MAG: hypothetical protein ACLTSX_13145 [Collinsella sp.]